MQKFIIFFDSNNDFDNKLKISLIQQKCNLIIIQLKHINEWTFFLTQRKDSYLSGVITSPLNILYDLSSVVGMYLNCPMFNNAWHSLFTWFAYTIPNKLSNITSLNNINKYKVIATAEELGIKFKNTKNSHYAHCIGNHIFVSTINAKIAILPPKFARKLAEITRKLDIDQAEFELAFDQKSWFLTGFNLNPNWANCAFPEEFVFKAICIHLTSKCRTPWQKLNKKPKLQKVKSSRENYINQKLIPEITGSIYNVI